jgi:hypothetical protein
VTPNEQLERQLQRYIDFLHQYNFLDVRAQRAVNAPGFRRAFIKTIRQAGHAELARHSFRVAPLRTLNKSNTPFLLMTSLRHRAKGNVVAFVGHRFVSNINSSLRHNLQLVLAPYRIKTVYADTDLPNGDLFRVILSRIRASAFCIFDDRETETRPNVFIELGAALAMERPYLYFAFQKKRTVNVGRKAERITVPSDLAGVLYLPYSSYEQLFADFSMRLPGFLRDRRLTSAAVQSRRRQ